MEPVTAMEPCTHSVTDGGWIAELAYRPDGQLLAIAPQRNPVDANLVDYTAKLMTVSDPIVVRTLQGHKDWLTSVAFSRDGQRVATGSRDRTIRVWDPATGNCLATLEDHSAAVNDVVFSDNKLFSADDDGRILAWDTMWQAIPLNTPPRSMPITHLDCVAETLVSLNAAGEICFWSVETGDPLSKITCHGRSIRAITLRPDGQRLATAIGNTIDLWDTSRATPVRPRESGHSRAIRHWSRTSPSLPTESGWRRSETTRMYDCGMRNPALEMLTLQAPSEDTTAIAFRPTGKQLAVAHHGSVSFFPGQMRYSPAGERQGPTAARSTRPSRVRSNFESETSRPDLVLE